MDTKKKSPRSETNINFDMSEHKSHEAWTGHTEDDAAMRDAITHEEPTAPGQSTGDAQIDTFMGKSGEDYEATWGIAMSMRILPKT